ncbi:uncharacterized protein [Antedon mediterranea]|uniref:uncharacterized protein isoform X2 n=1 Tax=Antedon mediterranea TaxID=105859 RepID=UPI003AF94286
MTCSCCCKKEMRNNVNCSCYGLDKCSNCTDDGSTSDLDITIIVVSFAAVVVIIGILITICYWIKRKDRNQRPPHSPKVKYAANGETIEVQGEPSVSTQPLPAIPVTNHYTLAELQNNTYEQIKPCYSSLKRNSNGSEDYTTLNKNVDVNASSAEGIEDKTRTMSSTNRDEVANTYAQLTKKPATKYTTPYLENEITPKQATPKQNDDYEDTEVAYDKLKHHACTRPNDDDISDDYNKLASVTADGDLEDDYSHLDRTSKNVSSGVKNQYSQLELTAANAADGTNPRGETNQGYEDTWLSKTPENENPVMVQTENDKNCAKEPKVNGGYEQAIINN